jgi:hypothetical protein
LTSDPDGEFHPRLLTDSQLSAAPDPSFNGALVAWFHPHRGDQAAQDVLQAHIRAALPRADLLMFSYLGEITRPVALQLAAELHLLVASNLERSSAAGRRYREVILVAYGAGIPIVRKVRSFGAGKLRDHPYPEPGFRVMNTWAAINRACRVYTIARESGPGAWKLLPEPRSAASRLWRRIRSRLESG